MSNTPELSTRIEKAMDRIKNGDACMRIPADPTDPDIVLADCQAEVERLQSEVQQLTERLEATASDRDIFQRWALKSDEERDALAKQLQESVRRESGYREELAAERAYCEKLKKSVLGVGKER